ncbi:MAG: hypothetical protein ACHQNT_01950 [Bacteroidia bacterium]
MNRKICLFLFIVILGANNASAQEAAYTPMGSVFDNFFTFAWDVNIPMGDKYVDATSYAGGKLEYRKMINDNNLSVGFDVSWNSYYEYKSYQTYEYNSTTDVTTDLYKYNYTLPLALTLHKYFPGNSAFLPYIGLGLGATYSRPSLFFNIYEIYEDNWGFLARPELGTIIKFDKGADVGVLLGVRYSYSTNKEEGFKIENLQALGFQLGVVWMY